MEKVKIDLGEKAYDIVIGDSIDNIDSYINKYSKILIISNTTVGPIYGERVKKALKGRETYYHEIPDGEEYKNLDTIKAIYDIMIDNHFTRDSLVISLGGGVVCDLTGYVASTYMRGIDFVQIPTSLLAQVDASVGGKVAINYRGKNLIGSFYQPQLVFVDTEVLNTLDLREIKTGIVEIIKMACTFDVPFTKFLKENAKKLLSLDKSILADVIKKACELKAYVVSQDEKEKGMRALLNFGHTYAHAVERLTDYKVYRHGEAVAIGIKFIGLMAVKLGLMSKELYDYQISLLDEYEIDSDIMKFDFDRLLEVLKRDKKNKGNELKFVITPKNGVGEIINIHEDDLKKYYDEICDKDVVASIDIGTNSTRLKIAEVKDKKILNSYCNEMEITKLGEDVDKTSNLKDEAIDRTFKVLKKYKDLTNKYGAKEIKLCATSALRDAQNSDKFKELVKKELGFEIEIIDGEEEALLSFRGATIDRDEDVLVIDIGGGSTEIILGKGSKIDFIKSYNFGAVRLTEKFFKNEDFISSYDEAKKFVFNLLDDAKKIKENKFNMIGLAGTITTQVTILKKMTNYDRKKVHNYILTKDEVINNLELLKSKSLIDRKSLPGLHPKRAEVAVAGTMIILWLMEFFNKDNLIVSENDILDGILIK